MRPPAEIRVPCTACRREIAVPIRVEGRTRLTVRVGTRRLRRHIRWHRFRARLGLS